MGNDGLATKPMGPDDDFDRALHRAVATLPATWVLLTSDAMRPDVSWAAEITGVLFEAGAGIALIGPGPNPTIVVRFQAALEAAGVRQAFGELPPIVYRPLPPPELPLDEILAAAFSLEPPPDLSGGAEWVGAVRAVLMRVEAPLNEPVPSEPPSASAPMPALPAPKVTAPPVLATILPVAQPAAPMPMEPGYVDADVSPPRKRRLASLLLPSFGVVVAGVIAVSMFGLNQRIAPTAPDDGVPRSAPAELPGPPAGQPVVEAPGMAAEEAAPATAADVAAAFSFGPFGAMPQAPAVVTAPTPEVPSSTEPEAQPQPVERNSVGALTPDLALEAKQQRPQDAGRPAELAPPSEPAIAAAPDSIPEPPFVPEPAPPLIPLEPPIAIPIPAQIDRMREQPQPLPVATEPPEPVAPAGSPPPPDGSVTGTGPAAPERSDGSTGQIVPAPPPLAEAAATPLASGPAEAPYDPTKPDQPPGTLPPASPPLQTDIAKPSGATEAGAEPGRVAIEATTPFRDPALPDLAPALHPGPQTAPPAEPAELPGNFAPSPTASRLAPEMLTALVRRGQAMFDFGDISGARLLFQRAAEGGSAAAATLLGKTYDPGILSGIGTRGLLADRRVAADWYRRAIALGDREAEILLARLDG